MSIFLSGLFIFVIIIVFNAMNHDMSGLSERMKKANISVFWIPVVICFIAGIYNIINGKLLFAIFFIVCGFGWIKYINQIKKKHKIK
jgi:hypothetical protein